MTLIFVIFVIIVQRYLQLLSVPLRGNWLALYYDWCEKKIEYVTKGHGLLGLAILVVPVLFIVSIVFSIFYHMTGIVGYSVLIAALLWYCIDVRDLKKQPLVNMTAISTLDQVYRDCFAVLFWFTLFGPLGVTLYYMVRFLLLHFEKHPSSESKELSFHARRVLAVLDWVPVRLYTFSFALVGHFSSVFKVWIKSIMGGFDFELNLVHDCGHAVVKTADESISLLNRVLIVWLVVIALVTIGLILG